MLCIFLHLKLRKLCQLTQVQSAYTTDKICNGCCTSFLLMGMGISTRYMVYPICLSNVRGWLDMAQVFVKAAWILTDDCLTRPQDLNIPNFLYCISWTNGGITPSVTQKSPIRQKKLFQKKSVSFDDSIN